MIVWLAIFAVLFVIGSCTKNEVTHKRCCSAAAIAWMFFWLLGVGVIWRRARHWSWSRSRP
jgi:hypothetical protein